MKYCSICKCEIKNRNNNQKYCVICKFNVWKTQKRDWKRKKVGTYGKKMVCKYCKEELGDDSKTDRIYCVDCAVIRDKILHHISYLRRRKNVILS